MAQELRHETLFGSGTTSGDALAEFRNDSAGMIHIRGIDWEAVLFTAANDERGSAELSKAPAFQGATNNGPFFRFGITLGANAGTIGSGADDISVHLSRSRRWGRGQLTLEPNESLFYNRSILSGTPGLRAGATIEYEFA